MFLKDYNLWIFLHFYNFFKLIIIWDNFFIKLNKKKEFVFTFNNYQKYFQITFILSNTIKHVPCIDTNAINVSWNE